MPKGFDWLWFCLHGTLLPAGGEGGRRKRKEPHDGKKIFPYRLHRNPRGFLRSCGIRKTSLRQRLHSTATLFGCFQYIRNGCSSQGCKRKKCSCSRKIFGETGAGLGFERTASTASVCTLAEKRCLPYRSDLLISKHIRCGHTPEKWRSGLSAEAPFSFLGIVPNPLASIYIGAILSAKIITLLACGFGINYNRVDEQRRNCNRETYALSKTI